MVTSCEQHNLYRKPPYNTAPPESFRKASRTPHICAPSHLNTVVDGYQTCSRKMAMMMSHAPMAESIGWDKTEQISLICFRSLQGNTWVNPVYTPRHLSKFCWMRTAISNVSFFHARDPVPRRPKTPPSCMPRVKPPLTTSRVARVGS